MTPTSPTARVVGDPVVPGLAAGPLVVSREPLSFWGGYDAATGRVIDRRHPLVGRELAHRVVALPSTRGSSTTTAVLLEAVRAGTAPAGVLTRGRDRFLALASIVAEEMYGAGFPVVSLSGPDFAALPSAGSASVGSDGRIEIRIAAPAAGDPSGVFGGTWSP